MSRKGQREEKRANRLQGDRRLDDIQIVTKSSRGGKPPRESETRSTRSRPLIYDKGERWPEWCKLGVISHHLGIRCTVTPTLRASRAEHAISFRAVPSLERTLSRGRKLHPRTRKRERERGGSNFRPFERRLGRIPVAVFSELTTRASKWKWNANRIHCVWKLMSRLSRSLP